MIMRNHLFLLFKLLVYWFVVLFINRLAFILYFLPKFSGISIGEIAATFLHGLRLDISACCYLLLLPVFALIIQQFISYSFYKKFLLVYTVVMLVVISFISVFDLGIYDQWGLKLNYRAISYLKYAGEGSEFTKFSSDLILAMILVIQVAFGLLLFYFSFRNETFRFPWSAKSRIQGILLYVLLFPLLFIGIRGGLQQIPVNESSAYFSAHAVVNDAAVNTFWNAGKKFAETKNIVDKNPYEFLPEAEAKKIVADLYEPKKDSTISLLSNNRPNIVIFILESFTADVVTALGGEKNVAPNFDTLVNKGVLFTNIYSQGFRTDQGLADVLSGFPAQPNFSIIMQPEKFRKLPFLPATLVQAGYHPSFFYGGETEFANMKAYLVQAGIESITDKNDFTPDQMGAKWGAHDGFVFQKQGKDIGNSPEPFFSVILSLSSHEPFEVPGAPRFPGNDIASQFKNAVAYTDESIGEYFQTIKNTSWYSNTLFVFVADHGHEEPRSRSPKEPARFHIPLLFYGDVIRPEFRGSKISNIGMQVDLTATLLSQLGLPADAFPWSNNLLNPFRNNFAYYTSDDAFGWITDHGSMIYDFKVNEISSSNLTKEEENEGKAFLQELFGQYVAY
jgi:phosphoglycerol transferase MdoB-like AlkP superfamily enzyme